MTVLLPYLLKVVLCSALLMSYYYLALRNKLFHQWNRFYLLATVILSLLIPGFTFTISHTPAEANSQVIQVLQVVTVSGPFEEPVVETTDSFWKVYGVLVGYACVSMVLFTGLLFSLYSIYKLVKQHTVQQHGTLHLIFTTAKGTPFSFFKYLFWNPSIDMTADAGQQIFKHELVHIEEKHSLDKLFMQLVLIVGWINPVFWLIRHELRMVHEFIADRKAVQDQDASVLAAMILQASYPQHYSQLTNAFFHQSIKRRLHMLTKIQNPKRNYISRILLLPLMAVLTLAFTVRTELTDSTAYTKAVKPMALSFNPMNIVSNRSENSSVIDKDSLLNTAKSSQPVIRYTGKKKVKVVVDAGHGGHDNGAGSNAVFEKDIALAIAKELQALNTNANIEVIMTRQNDHYVQLRERVDFAAKQQADLFVSIHTSAAPPVKTETGTTENPKRGFEVYIPRDTVSYVEQSKLLGSSLLHQLNTVAALPTHMQLLQQKVGVWVLNQNICPSVLVECGYISNEKDRSFLLQKENRQQVAQKLLAGIESYLQAVDQKPLSVIEKKMDANYIAAVIADTIPPIILQSGATLTVSQLQSIPFAKIIQPDTDYKMISSTFSIGESGETIYYVKVNGSEMNSMGKDLLGKAKSGDMIFIEHRRALMKDGKERELPGLFYYVK